MFDLHEWDLSPSEAIALQVRLANKVEIKPLSMDFQVLGSADLAYLKSANLLVAVMMTFRWPSLELLETSHVVAPISFPYISGLLSFREIPPLLEAFVQLKRPPDAIICDGQGIAHPRRLGFASHLGLCLGIPTVGCAKSRLCGIHEPFDLRKGNYSPLIHKEEVIGRVFCTRNGVKPLFISPGHRSDLDSSTELVRRCLGRFRIPEPQRQAHNLATRLRQQLAKME